MKQQIEQLKTADLVPYARNAKKHDDAQVAKIAGSIREFGFCNPVLIDADNGIIAGHGRVMAAQKLGLESVPCLRLSHLTETQKRAYILADNRLAEIGGGWDGELLKLELADLDGLDVDLDSIGFGADDLAGLELGDDGNGDKDKEEPYSRKIEIPVYEPHGPKPPLSELCDSKKTKALVSEIDASNLPEADKDFLKAAAQRHLVFDYGKVAEYYAHSPAMVQRLFENSALVFIDFNKAVADGYVRLTDEIRETYLGDYPKEGEA